MKRVVCIVGAMAIAVGLALPAAAHDKAFKSRVTAQFSGGGLYEGDVISPSAACERRRPVQFWFDDPGSEPDELIDTIEATREGHWSYEFLGPAYYAKVKREVVKSTPRHRHVCKGDRSPTV